MARISIAVIALLSVFFLPFWASLSLAVLGMAYFPLFWEAAAVFFVSDLLYGVERQALLEITFISTLVAVILLLMMELLKKRLRFYPNNQ